MCKFGPIAEFNETVKRNRPETLIMAEIYPCHIIKTDKISGESKKVLDVFKYRILAFGEGITEELKAEYPMAFIGNIYEVISEVRRRKKENGIEKPAAYDEAESAAFQKILVSARNAETKFKNAV
ncbi:hypothetical protein C0583_01865 [Candidatus Parcubacteria bacterium]|nr:MAG: hypothetical protein C0583_01865 [Candidatus Parcubacteria bacterium]